MKRLKLIIIILFLMLIMPVKVSAVTAQGNDSGVNWVYNDGVLTLEGGTFIKYSSTHTWDAYKNSITKVVINDGIDSVGAHAFENYPNLEEVVFPKNMCAEIAEYAFYNCSKINNIELPDLLSRIGEYAFYGTGITSVDIPIFTGWVEEHAFNDNTTMNKLIDQTNLVDAGTAGFGGMLGAQRQEGSPNNNTCYNHFYYTSYYGSDVLWKLDKEGVLTVWGNGRINTGGSRVPWGCYGSSIKKIILNDEKTGKITKINKTNQNQKLKGTVLAVYSSKPVDEIMENKFKTLEGTLMYDCRVPGCNNGFPNLEEIVVNRGTETIKSGFVNLYFPSKPADIYISKYVKNIEQEFYQDNKLARDGNKQNVHLEVSYDDYVNNNYDYYDMTDDNGFVNTIDEKGLTFINNIDDSYVSLNDDYAEREITVDGKTLYLYDVYITNKDGEANISISNDDNEYYVKEIAAPEGFKLDKSLKKLDMSKDDISINLYNEPISSDNDDGIISPKTSRNIVIILLIVSSMIIITVILKKKKKETI